jgi:hypothetical protein
MPIVIPLVPAERKEKLMRLLDMVEQLKELHRKSGKLMEELTRAILKKESEMSEETMVFTKRKYLDLRNDYLKAVEEDKKEFEFEGHRFLTAYAKYLLEYLTMELEKRGELTLYDNRFHMKR